MTRLERVIESRAQRRCENEHGVPGRGPAAVAGRRYICLARLFLNAGIVVLLATPVARVVVSIVDYVKQRDRVFVVLTTIVFRRAHGERRGRARVQSPVVMKTGEARGANTRPGRSAAHREGPSTPLILSPSTRSCGRFIPARP